MKTPILFIVFNRPKLTKKVFDRIRSQEPERLYIVADGPRSLNETDKQSCDEVREIFQSIDWPCEVFKLFRDKNLGCRNSVSGGISWFFENEERGIIIEDDIVPSDDFFSFCEAMLERYQHDERVMMITGTNYLPNPKNSRPYLFSEHFTIWGWATWRRAWNLYDVNMTGWESTKVRNNLRYKFNNSYIWRHFKNTFDSLKGPYSNTWDIQWVYTCLTNSGLCVVPRVNFVTNIGVEGAHSSILTDSHFLPTQQLNCDILNSPNVNVLVDAEYDYELHKLKTIPAQRRKSIRKILAFFGIAEISANIYRALRNIL